VGEHSGAVAMKRRGKVRLAAALRRRGPARGATPGAAAACAARGGRKAGGGRRFDTLPGRRQARAPWEEAGWARPVQAGVASGR
jgi:hypothetical protein